MQFILTRKVKAPERNVRENTGIDIYIPDNTPEFAQAIKEKNTDSVVGIREDLQEFRNYTGRDWPEVYFNTTTGRIQIAPHCAVIIPTGIRSKFGPNIALIANNKSGIATKKQLL